MFKTSRRKELERKEAELHHLKSEIEQIKNWCAHDSPSVGFAMLRLQNLQQPHTSISAYREALRTGQHTFELYVIAQNNTTEGKI